MIKKIFTITKNEGVAGLVRRLVMKFGLSLLENDANKILLNEVFNYSSSDLALSKDFLSDFNELKNRPVKTVNWFFIPSVSHPMGGVSTIFRFAHYMATEKGVINNFILCGETSATEDAAAERIGPYVPGVTKENIYKVKNLADFTKIPSSDISIATRWDTALYLLRFNRTQGKFYFMQDFEPLFFPASVNYMLAEATYRFGFHGIANSIGLYKEYIKYSPNCEYFIPGVDKEVYFPPEKRKSESVNIVFYARPGVIRNGFELGIEALKIIKKKYQGKVRIFTAGGTWDASKYGLEGVVENLGMLESVAAVAELYRSCDIGLAFIFTKHPSYQPIEFMASGTAVVTNFNMHTGWLLKDGQNCLLTEPTIHDVVEKLEMLIGNPDLRARLVESGLAEVEDMQWEREWPKIWKFIKND